ncbi:MAG TPA: tripartite tricarboxylate transporter substrate binding protein [Beijerinckiaceae bacterium]
MRLASARALAAGVIACAFAATAAAAQTVAFPTKRITIVVPAVAGGATDIVARIISQNLTAALGQGVVVENRSGASGNIGAQSVVQAEPDGHTLLLAATNNLVVNQFIMANVGHDPLTDLVPVAYVAEAPELVAVHHAFPAATIQEFVAALKQKPGAYNYGTPGVGSVPHLSAERFLRVTGTKMTHVPFRGSAAAMTDVGMGAIQMSMATLGSVEPFRQAGTARILAVTASRRLPALPDVPTLDESGYKGLEMANWWGVVAPKGTPRPVVELLNAKLREIFSTPANVAQLERLGILGRSETIGYFEDFVRKEAEAWAAVVKDLGLDKR